MMHLEGPWLSTTGKRKTKRKFRNAAEAQRARDNANSWQELLKQHEVKRQASRRKRAMTAAPYVPKPLSYRGSEQPRIPSLPFTGDACSRPQDKVYTGTAIKGIGTLHKSNAVPVFTDQEAVDIARMRR
jgi:hypothetical protein